MANQALSAGDQRKGKSQNSWWKVLLVDEANDRVVALCIKDPEQYKWVQAGEAKTMPLRAFTDMTEPL